MRARSTLAASLFFVLATATAIAGAAPASTPTVINACYNRTFKQLRIVNSTSECRRDEEPLTWNVEGPAGATGATGPVGPIGPVGPMGATGPAGSAGPAGSTGATGAAGPAGSAGATGANGATGAQGPVGATGANGATGAQGPAGATGANGATGAQGPVGATGANGASGAAGATGATGATGLVNFRGPYSSTTAYNIGDAVSYDDAGAVLNSTYIAIQANTGQAPNVGGNNAYWDIVAQAGVNGATGATGSTGLNGANGATGPTGPSGTSGIFGSNSLNFNAGEGGTTQCTLGSILLNASSAYPSNYLPADGRTMQIASNTALFSLLGTNYGGNGTTTFVLPNLKAAAPNNTQYLICVSGVFP